MATWGELAVAAPRIAETFERPHAVMGILCLLGRTSSAVRRSSSATGTAPTTWT